VLPFERNASTALQIAVMRLSVIGRQAVCESSKKRGSNRLLALTAAGLSSVATTMAVYRPFYG
jgi:hypothetical protein